MHRVGTHRQGRPRLTDIQYNAPARRLGIKNVDCAANRVIEVELLQLDLIFLPQQTTQVSDDFSRALVVAANVGENFRELSHVRRVGCEEDFCRLCVAQDGAKAG